MYHADAIVRSKNPAGAANVPGRIAGRYAGRAYCDMMASYNIDMSAWDREFPGWVEKTVYAVSFDAPLKTCTLDQWLDHARAKGVSAEAALDNYKSQCPESRTVCIPSDDLELFDGGTVGHFPTRHEPKNPAMP